MGHSKREEQEPLGTAPWASRSLYKIFDSLEMGSSHALWHSLFQRWVDIHMGINAPPPTLPVALCRGAKVCSSRSEGSKWMRTRPAVTTQGFTFLYPQIPKNCRFWRLPSKLLSTHYSLVSSVQSVTFCGNSEVYHVVSWPGLSSLFWFHCRREDSMSLNYLTIFNKISWGNITSATVNKDAHI